MSNNLIMTTLLWQLYDPQGRPIHDGGAAKLKAVMEGRLHGSAHVWVWRHVGDDIEVLVQKRAATKINWPGRLDKSAGGHITYGERPIETALRKAQAELGLKLLPEQLLLAGIRHWKAQVESADMVENDFQWLYTVELPEPHVNVPTAEVEEVMWKSLGTLQSGAGNDSMKLYVPYGWPYFVMLHDAITQRVDVAFRSVAD